MLEPEPFKGSRAHARPRRRWIEDITGAISKLGLQMPWEQALRDEFVFQKILTE